MEVYFLVAERGASLIVRKLGVEGLFWIIGDDLPDHAIVLRAV
jgi:hypothetical protein